MLENEEPSLGESVNLYLHGLADKERQEVSQDLNRFVQWCGRDTTLASLTPQTVASYAARVSLGGGDPSRKLGPVKAFLTFLKAKNRVHLNLASHLRATKVRLRTKNSVKSTPVEMIQLTEEGYKELTARLEALKGERVKIISDIGRAMADKDFRENAPLDAAKERQGFTESMIKELEATLGFAVVADLKKLHRSPQVVVGKKVSLKDINSGRKVSYIVVHPREANPTEGRLSSESPVGKALMNKYQGVEIKVAAPKGTITYLLESVSS